MVSGCWNASSPADNRQKSPYARNWLPFDGKRVSLSLTGRQAPYLFGTIKSQAHGADKYHKSLRHTNRHSRLLTFAASNDGQKIPGEWGL